MQNYTMRLDDDTTIEFVADNDDEAKVIADFTASCNNQDIVSIFNVNKQYFL